MSMIFGGILSHLWKDIGKQNSAEAINQLLDFDKKCPVQKLLDEDHTLTELRNNNQKLLNYFNHEKVLELLHYIVIEPEEDCTYKRGHRYPFVASDLLGVEQNSMLDEFFKETQVRIPKQRAFSVMSKRKDLLESPEDDCQEGEQEDKQIEQEGVVGEDQDQKINQVLKEKSQQKTQEKVNEDKSEEPTTTTTTATEQETETIIIPSPKTVQDEVESNQEQILPDQQIKEPQVQIQKQLPNDQETENNSEALTIEEPIVPQKFINSEQENQTQLEKQEEEQKDSDEQIEEPVPNPPTQESLPQLQEITQPLEQQSSKDDLMPLQNNDDQEEKLTTITGSTLADTEDEFDIIVKNECLELLFSFVSDTQAQLNPVLCGYFSRIVNSLLNKRLKQLAEYLFSNFQILQNMVSHLESRSIYELVIRILKIDQSIFDIKELEVDIYKSRMISCLIHQLSSNNTKWQNLNSSQVLCEIIENSKLWAIICTNPQFIQTIIKNILNPGSTSSLHSSLKVFGSMLAVCGKWKTCWEKSLFNMQEIDYNNAIKCIKALEELQIEYQDNYDNQDEETHSKISIQGIFEKMFELYNENNHSTQLLNCSYGRNIIPFGKTRLLVSKVLKSAVQIESSGVTDAILKSKNYVGIYQWNNMLHVFADNIFTFILSGTQTINQNTTYKLKNHLLFELNFVDWLAELSSVPKFEFQSTRKLRTGYMPFVHKFSNQLVNLGKNDNETQSLLNKNEAFMTYKNGDLQEMNDINSRPLGGLKTGQNKQDQKVSNFILVIIDLQTNNQQSEQQKDDLNVSFSVDDIYKQYNELSARYNSKRSSTASSVTSQQDSGALEDQQEEEEEDQGEDEEEFDEQLSPLEQGNYIDLITSQSPSKKDNDDDDCEFQDQSEEISSKKCNSIKLGTQDVQDGEQDIYEYEDYQKRFTQTMKNITSEHDDDNEDEDDDDEGEVVQEELKEQDDEQSLSSLFMEKKLMNNREKRNIRLRYQQQEDDEKEEDDMNDRDQQTDELFKYAQQVSSSSSSSKNTKDVSKMTPNKSINPFQAPDEEIFVSEQVKSMSFGDKKLHLELKPLSPEKNNTQYFTNNYWKVDLNKNYDIDQLLKDFI